MKALIDADILVYRVGFASEDVTEESIVKWRLNDMISRMLDTVEADDFTCYLTSTDRSNFRFTLYPEYKGHRTKPKPKYYDFLRQVLVEDYAAEVVSGVEADDSLGIAQIANWWGDGKPKGTNQSDFNIIKGPQTVICTIDKDLDMIPGWHYNFVKERKYYISDLEAYRSFYWQVLVGDKASDNIDGCPDIGKVKATKYLEGSTCEKEMYDLVVRKYKEAFVYKGVNALWLAGQLLWIRRVPDQGWTRPTGEVVSKNTLENSFKSLE